MLVNLISFLSASVFLTISPGPDIIYVLLKSMSDGKKAGILVSLGLVTGIIVHTTLVAFGVATVINQSKLLFTLLKIFGAAYLLYIAFSIYKSDTRISLKAKTHHFKKENLFKRGFLMNVLNPKVSIFFLAFFPSFVWDTENNVKFQFYMLGFIFMLQAFLIFSLVAISAGKVASYIQENTKILKVFKWIQIVVFVSIAILLFL